MKMKRKWTKPNETKQNTSKEIWQKKNDEPNIQTATTRNRAHSHNHINKMKMRCKKKVLQTKNNTQEKKISPNRKIKQEYNEQKEEDLSESFWQKCVFIVKSRSGIYVSRFYHNRIRAHYVCARVRLLFFYTLSLNYEFVETCAFVRMHIKLQRRFLIRRHILNILLFLWFNCVFYCASSSHFCAIDGDFNIIFLHSFVFDRFSIQSDSSC